jgi:hypothetical protein
MDAKYYSPASTEPKDSQHEGFHSLARLLEAFLLELPLVHDQYPDRHEYVPDF